MWARKRATENGDVEHAIGRWRIVAWLKDRLPCTNLDLPPPTSSRCAG